MCHRSHCSLFPSHEPFAQILPIYLNWFLPLQFRSNHPCQGRPVWWCPVATVDAADDQPRRVPRIPPSKYVPETHPSRVEGSGGTPNSRRSKTCRPQTASSQISDAHHLQSQWVLARTSRLDNGCHDPWDGVNGFSWSGSSETKVRGLLLMQASISWRVVSNSARVKQFPPTVFLRADFTDLTSLSHHPPHQGELGAMNRHSGVRGPNWPRILSGAATNPLALSG